MKLFLIFNLFLFQFLLANDFANKKLIKLPPSEDNFSIIDLHQQVKTQNLDEQEPLFDSSTLIEKKSISKDKDVDFAILIGHKTFFGFAMDDFSTQVKEFSNDFAKKLIQNLKSQIKLVDANKNKLYQSQNNLNFFSKELKLVDVSSFLDQNQSQMKTIDYVIVVGLNDFATGGWRFLNIDAQEAYAEFSLYVFDTQNKKFIISNTINIKLDLKKLSPKEAAEFSLEQMSASLANTIEDRVKNLKVKN